MATSGFKQNFENIRLRTAGRLASTSRAGYIGGQGDDNLGDEAMLDAVGRLFPGVKLIDIVYPIQENRLAKLGLSGTSYFDYAILSGGTLINSHWREKVTMAIDQGLPIFAIGTGVGSPDVGMEETNSRDWRELLSHFVGIGVRGPRSAAKLRAMGVERFEVIGDLALCLTPETVAPAAAAPEFAINVTTPKGQTAGDFSHLGGLEETVGQLIAQGWKCRPVAMHRADYAALELFLKRIPGAAMHIAMPTTAEEFFAVVGPCAFTVTQRLHTAILAACVGVPSVMIGRLDKYPDFMESMDLGEWYIDLTQKNGAQQIAPRIADLIECAPGMRSAIHGRALQWKRKILDYTDTVKTALKSGSPARETVAR